MSDDGTRNADGAAVADEEARERARASRRPDFWEALYLRAETGWDLGGPTPVLRAALDTGLLGEPGRIVVPGAGRGYDAVLLAERGFAVTAVDFSASAVAHLQGEAAARGLEMDVRQQDVFALEEEPAGCMDACFEYTCFVAIDPALRERYAALLTHLVRPGGRLLFLAFPLGKESPGPPHGLTLEELEGLFGEAWRWVIDTEAPASVEARRPMERLVLLERRAGA
ncbi:MAG: methyltransferase domain-containing protein [Deltaproteobacteria bacterium]|nr:MAG: methyltransferase domain-containing protein [Deltaproteobacteria bacterium]